MFKTTSLNPACVDACLVGVEDGLLLSVLGVMDADGAQASV